MSDVQRNLKSFVERTGDKTIPATLGMKNSDGSYSLHVPGKRGYVYITFGGPGGFGGGFGAARGYTGGTPGMPVKVKMRNGIGEIIGVDQDQLTAYAPGTTTPPATIQPHTHAIGGGMVDPVEGLRFLPGLVRPYSVAGAFGLQVWIESFFYKNTGDLIYFAGQAFDLTSYVPSTSSKKAWVIVGVDPADNTATAISGSEVALAVTMNASQLSGTTVSDVIPLVAIVLTNGQTVINDLKTFVDCRPYVSI